MNQFRKQRNTKERFGYDTRDRGNDDIKFPTQIVITRAHKGWANDVWQHTLSEYQNGRGVWRRVGNSADKILWNGSKWQLKAPDSSDATYQNDTNSQLPPKTGWYIYPYAQQIVAPTGTLLKYSDEISLQNLSGSTPNFLGSCGYAEICTDNQAVSTFTNGPGDYLNDGTKKGKWRILASQGNASTASLNYGDTIMLQSVNNGWILETCGLSDCNNGHQLYNVSTYDGLRSPMLDVQRWKIVSSTGATGAVRTGDDIKLLNLAGVTSYLNTCKLGSRDAGLNTSNWKINNVLQEQHPAGPLLSHVSSSLKGWLKSDPLQGIYDRDSDWDVVTTRNDGTVNCNSYCSTGLNDEAKKYSTCSKATRNNINPNPTWLPNTKCSDTNGTSGLTCYCKDPYDVVTTRNEGSVSCDTYCSNGLNDEAKKNSTCAGVLASDSCVSDIISGTFTTNGGRIYSFQTPKKIDNNTFVFGGSDGPPPLINMGGTATCSPNCGVCTGDCDGDVDCAGDLQCFERESSTDQVPGCSIGGAGDVGTHDYCYDSSIQFNPDYDKMTVGNNGGANCNDYCSTGWNNEAVKGSTCVKAANTTTGALAGCSTTIPSGGLTCYCKNP
jgi:hypothetical protein